MNPNIDPNSYSTLEGSKRLEAKLAQLEADPSKRECISIIRALHIQLLDLDEKLREKKSGAVKTTDNEYRLNQRIDTLTKYCKTMATDRQDYMKREKERIEKLEQLTEELKEKRQLFKMLYGYAADRLSEVDRLKRDVAALQAEKVDTTSSRPPVSVAFKLPGSPVFVTKTVLGKRKAREASPTVSSTEPPSSEAAFTPLGETSPPSANEDAEKRATRSSSL
ncbi:hypothetical protein NX059_007371 [Plenodomus lindquistii]|nr:hypothetical protein NX059_007371 [Plenodomus lindquistii]